MAGRCNSLEKHGDRERCMLLDEAAYSSDKYKQDIEGHVRSGHFSDIERLRRAE